MCSVSHTRRTQNDQLHQLMTVSHQDMMYDTDFLKTATAIDLE